MKRLHLHVSVDDLDRSVAFYETLFGAAPTVRKDDYAKWLLDDPRVNFAVSARGRPAGLDHLGLQTDSDAELSEIAARLTAAGAPVFDERATTCCYAKSNKTWVEDPSGLKWETFHTFGDSTVYGVDAAIAPQAADAGACCPASAA